MLPAGSGRLSRGTAGARPRARPRPRPPAPTCGQPQREEAPGARPELHDAVADVLGRPLAGLRVILQDDELHGGAAGHRRCLPGSPAPGIAASSRHRLGRGSPPPAGIASVRNLRFLPARPARDHFRGPGSTARACPVGGRGAPGPAPGRERGGARRGCGWRWDRAG